MSKFRDTRLYEALDYLDEAYIAEVVENLKVPPAPGIPPRRRGQFRYIAALAACLFLLSAAIPVIDYVLRNYTDIGGLFVSETTAESPNLTEPETPPEESTRIPPETSADTDNENETTAPLYDGTTAEPEIEHNGSYGLEYRMNEDGKSAMLFYRGICTDENVIVASVWNGVPVTTIAEAAFADYTKYKTITVPESVTIIGMRAFKNCTGLESVILHDGISYIGADAFENCELLKEITLPKSLDCIPASLFANCINLERVVIGNEVERIVFGAFYDCSALRELYYLGTIAEWNKIEKDEFWNIASSITVVHCSDGDVEIEKNTNCTHPEYTATENMPTCTESATVYYSCLSCGYGWNEILPPLGHKFVNNICTDCGAEAEYDGSQGLEYKISDDGTYAILVGIGTCTDTDIVVATTYDGLPVTRIGGGFYKIDTIRSVTVTENVTYIEGLRVCNNLEEIHLPRSLSDMYIDALRSNPKLKVITIDPANPKYSAVGNCLIEKETKTLIVGCTGSVIPSDGSVLYIGDEAFRGAGMTEITVPNGIIRFGSYAFASCKSLKSMMLPDSVTTVGYAVFYGCSSLESFVFSENTKTIGSWVFADCISLREVKMPTYGTMSEGVFDGCSSLKSIVIPIGQDILHISTFSNCASLESVVLPDTLTQIHSPFPECISLKSITIPAGVTIIEHDAFRYCTSLSEFNFKGTVAEWNAMTKENGWNRGCPFTVIHCSDGDVKLNAEPENDGSQGLEYEISKDGTYAILVGIGTCTDTDIVVATTYNGVPVTVIDSFAFYNCSFIEEVVIPEGVTNIATEAFYLCTNLKKVTLPTTLNRIDYWAFANCESLENIAIPDSVTLISVRAFSDCVSLSSLTLGNGVEMIEMSAFANCTSLSSLRFPKSLRLLENGAFDGCTSLATVYYDGTVDEWNSVDSTGRDYGITYIWYKGIPAEKIICSDGDVMIAH